MNKYWSPFFKGDFKVINICIFEGNAVALGSGYPPPTQGRGVTRFRFAAHP